MLLIKLKAGKAEVSVDGVVLPDIAHLDITCADGKSRIALEILDGDAIIEYESDENLPSHTHM